MLISISCRPCDATRSSDRRCNGARPKWSGPWRWHSMAWYVSSNEARQFAAPLGSDGHWNPCRMRPAPLQAPRGTEVLRMALIWIMKRRTGQLSVGGVCQSTGLRRAPALHPEIVENHAHRHCRDEDDHARRQGRKIFQSRPGAQSDKAPTDAEQRRADHQVTVDSHAGWPEVSSGEDRPRAAPDHGEARG